MHYCLEPFVHPVFPYIVRVEYSQIWIALLCTQFGYMFQFDPTCESCDTECAWSTSCPRPRLSGSPFTYSNTNNYVTLLGLVSEGASSIESSWSFYTVNSWFSSPLN